ncbi:MAG: cupin domain-containing protein [Caldisericia bacterium]|nr:cupin domain-containing protein [Caldisericia bacterium]
MVIVSLKDTDKIVPQMDGVKGVYKQTPLSKENGAPNFCFRVFTIEPGGHTPLHKHPFEHMNYVIQGQGLMVSDTQETLVNKGDFAYVEPNEMHQFKNPSQEQDFVFICAVPIEYE